MEDADAVTNLKAAEAIASPLAAASQSNEEPILGRYILRISRETYH